MGNILRQLEKEYEEPLKNVFASMKHMFEELEDKSKLSPYRIK